MDLGYEDQCEENAFLAFKIRLWVLVYAFINIFL